MLLDSGLHYALTKSQVTEIVEQYLIKMMHNSYDINFSAAFMGA